MSKTVHTNNGTFEIPAYTQHAWAGENYHPDMTTKDASRIIRKHLRQQLKETGFKVSVRMQRYSGGSSITIIIKAVPDGFVVREKNAEGYYQLTPAAKKVRENIDQFAHSFQRSDCDGMIDYFSVNFYIHVQYATHLR